MVNDERYENPNVTTIIDGVEQIGNLIDQIESHHTKITWTMYVSIAMVVLSIALSVLRLVSADPVTISVVPAPVSGELVPGRVPQSVPPHLAPAPPHSDPVPAPPTEGAQ